MSLDGKLALVTGAGRGIGRAIAVSLAERGATVVITARTGAQLAAVAEEIAGRGRGACHPVVADVTDEAAVAALVAEAEARGGVDILVNNAGGGVIKPLLETATAEWRAALEVNATAMFLVTRAVARGMIRRRGGRIVNISSIAGRRAAPRLAAYAASKYAAVGFTEVIARELRPHGIRVYSLCPGGVDTELRRAGVPDEDRSKIMQPEDIAALVTFLVGGAGAGLRELVMDIS